MNLPSMLKKIQVNAIMGINGLINGLINTRITQKSYKPANHNSNNVTYKSGTNAALIDFIKDNKIKYTITSKYGDKLNISIDDYNSHIHAVEIYPYY